MTTEDGYILSLFRIKSPNTKKGAPVVFMQHGVQDSADCWIMHHSELAPAFQLARKGYDVWLGNSRGNKYSVGHKTLDPKKDKQYWQFSFTEMGEYDLPAMTEFASKEAGVKKLAYIGHSQGTSQMFYALAEHPDYWKKKINLYTAFAPVTRLDNTNNGFLIWVSQFHTLFKNTLDLAGIWNLAPDNGFNKYFCSLLPDVCKFNEGLIVTDDPSLDDTARY